VLKDLIAGKIDHLHIQFHNCAWSPSEIIRNQGHDTEPDYYYYKQNSHDGGDNKRELAKRHRRLDELSYYQCGFNSGEEQWQSNFKPCFNANAAYSLYGGSGCGKETYINTFYTTDGLYAFLNAIQLDKNNYPSFTAWNYVNQSYYYENAQDLYYYDSYGKKKEKKQPKMKGASQENAYGVEFSANSNAGNSKNNYYGSNGKDYYGNHRELENNANNANNNGNNANKMDSSRKKRTPNKLYTTVPSSAETWSIMDILSVLGARPTTRNNLRLISFKNIIVWVRTTTKQLIVWPISIKTSNLRLESVLKFTIAIIKLIMHLIYYNTPRHASQPSMAAAVQIRTTS